MTKNQKQTEQEEYVSNANVDDSIKQKLIESSKKYPVWSPKNVGDIVSGTVENTEFLEHLNENTGGWIIRMEDINGEKFVVFPNKVMAKKLNHLSPTGELTGLIGKTIHIQYDGEVQPQNTKNKPYKTYSVIEG